MDMNEPGLEIEDEERVSEGINIIQSILFALWFK